MALTLIFAFFAGLVTVASPCILPILPIALSASAASGRARPLGVILGLVASFAIFTLVVSQLVALLGLSASTLRIIAVAVLALLGLSMVVPALQERLEMLFSRLPGLAPRGQRSGFAGGLLTGAALGLVWAPCAGPVLAAITTLAATSRVTAASAAVTAAYALGVGLPLLLVTYGGRDALRRVPALARRSGGVQRAFGVVMVVTALLIAFNVDVALTAWATNALPAGWNDRLQAFEDTPLVRGQIDRLVGRSGAPAAPVQVAAGGNQAQPVVIQAQPATATPENASARPASGTSGANSTNSPSALSGGADATGQGASQVNDGSAPSTLPAAGAATAGQRSQAQPTVAVPTAAPAPAPISPLPDGGPAPDFTGITHWINSPALHLADLRGKVVLVDFWTYSCINCIRTLPYVTAWYDKYHSQGLVVIGVHTPEFAFEKETPNVEQATQRYKINYPVAQDNNYATWTAFGNRYWPAEYFIDAQGHLRHTHFGEGNYDETERVIQALLAEAGDKVQPLGPAAPGAVPAAVPVSEDQTPETYVGLDRGSSFASPEQAVAGQAQTYSVPASLPLHSFALGGKWTLDGEYATANAAGDILRLHFVARDAYLVLASDAPATVGVSLPAAGTNQSEDVDAAGRLHVSEARLYHVVRLPGMQESTLELHFDQPGVRVYAFTFGS